MIEYILLGFLMNKEMSGYDIKYFMSHSTAYFYDASFGSIYPALKRMLSRGWIEVRETIEGGKYKKTYFILEKGRLIFLKWLETPLMAGKGKEEHLIQVFFYEFLPKPRAIALIGDFIIKVEAIIKELEELETRIRDKADIYKLSTLLYGKEYYNFKAAWYRGFLSELMEKE